MSEHHIHRVSNTQSVFSIWQKLSFPIFNMLFNIRFPVIFKFPQGSEKTDEGKNVRSGAQGGVL